MPNIHFIPCPIGPNKGQSWDKLRIASPGPWRLEAIEITMSDDLDPGFIKRDTFTDWTRENWRDLMQFFYGLRNPCLIILFFRDRGGKPWTTARGYSTRSHRYYLDMIGRDFTPLVKKQARDYSGARGSMDGPKNKPKQAKLQTREQMLKGGGNRE